MHRSIITYSDGTYYSSTSNGLLDVFAADFAGSRVEVVPLFPECSDPNAPVAKCRVCFALVHTCDVLQSDGSCSCPRHPDGVELSDGSWVCSEACWKVAVDDVPDVDCEIANGALARDAELVRNFIKSRTCECGTCREVVEAFERVAENVVPFADLGF
jgi:hypothetical protein